MVVEKRPVQGFYAVLAFSAREADWEREQNIEATCQCSLAVEHPLSEREVVGSNPAIGFVFDSSDILIRGLVQNDSCEIRTRALSD